MVWKIYFTLYPRLNPQLFYEESSILLTPFFKFCSTTLRPLPPQPPTLFLSPCLFGLLSYHTNAVLILRSDVMNLNLLSLGTLY